MRIGVFDSGIGGLSVLKCMITQNPENEYIYLADLNNSPFGSKTIEELKDIYIKAVDFFEKKKVDMFVCACGTLSTVCAEDIENMGNDKKIVSFGMLEGLKESMSKLECKNILLLATKATVDKKNFEAMLRTTKANIKAVACPEFVDILEKGICDEEYIQNVVNGYVQSEKNVDCIVLGCTHYPFLLKYIYNALENKQATIIELGKSLVKCTRYSKINSNNIKIENKDNGYNKDLQIYTTKNSEVFTKKVKELFKVTPKLYEIK